MEHARVKASAAAGTALEQDVGEGRGDRLQHAIQAEHIAMGDLSLAAVEQQIGAEFLEIAVHIPLNVADGCAAQDV